MCSGSDLVLAATLLWRNSPEPWLNPWPANIFSQDCLPRINVLCKIGNVTVSCSDIASILVLMYFTVLAIFWTSLCASIVSDRAPSDCLYSVAGPDRLFHQSMPRGAPSGAGWTVKQSTRSMYIR